VRRPVPGAPLDAATLRARSAGPFDDIETEILRQYFGLKPRLSRAQLLEAPPVEEPDDEDVDDEESTEAVIDARRGVRVKAGNTFEEFYADAPVANAVARICVNVIQNRLPNWTAIDVDEKFISSRKVTPARRAPVVSLPRHLFTINWADSGPGYPWPEGYHATHLIGFDRVVVTGSKDSDDVTGYTDLALGWFRPREDFRESCGRIVRRWWRLLRRSAEQSPWAYLLDAGEVDEETALLWRRKAFGDEERY
jgi:hypothetical protein